jgi:hypothetical protein
VSERGQMLAATLACGPGAGVSHFHSGSLWRVSRFPVPMLIDVVAPRQRCPGHPVRAHASRTLSRADIARRHRIPVTTPARMLVDLADVLTKFQLANVLHQAAYRGVLHFPSVEEVMARNNGRKLATLTRAIELHRGGSAGTRSTAEDAFLRLIEGRLPEPLVNTPLLGEEVDFHWLGKRLVVEVDGPAHGRPANRADDARKDAKLRDAGYTVVRVSDEAVHSGRAYAVVRAAYEPA